MNFFSKFKAGEYGYKALGESVKNFNEKVVTHDELTSLIDTLGQFSTILLYIMMASMLLFVFFGKKLLPLIKVVSCFAVGFGVGVCYIDGMIDKVVEIPAIVSGLVIAVLAVIIYRLIYVLFFAAFTFFGVFTLCNAAFGDALTNMLGDSKGLVLMGVAAVFVLVAFLLRKYVEMLGTSVLGGFVFAKLLKKLVWDFTAIGLFEEHVWIPYLVITVVLALPGFIVQVKTRKRY